MTMENEPVFLNLQNKGLFTMPNSLSNVPMGSMLTASNVVCDYDGLLSNRRGMTQFGTALIDPNTSNPQNIFQIFQYKGIKIIWTGDNLTASNATNDNNHLLWYDTDGNGTWALIQKGFPGPAMNLAPINTDRYHSAEGNTNIYYTSINGVLKQDDPSQPPYSAGGLPGLDGSGSLTGSSGWMSNDTEVAYRCVWAYTDKNNNLILGAPSTRLVVANPSNTTTITSVTDLTHLVVGSTANWVGSATGAVDTTIPRSFAFNISLIVGNTFTISSSANMIVGDTIIQGANATTIASIPGGGTSIVVTSATGFATGAAVDETPSQTINFSVTTVTDGTHLVVSSTAGMTTGDSIAQTLTSNVALTFTIPRGTEVTDQYQIYRSIMSATATTEPDDNLQLCISGNPASGDLTNGYFTITDTVPQESLQAYLYTDAGQSTNPGENQPNAPPPLSYDMCFYKQYMLYGGNCQTQETFLASMLAVGSPNGIQVGDTLTVVQVQAADVSWSNPVASVSSFTVTGGSSEVVSTGHFLVSTGSTPADNIVATKESLIRVINRYSANTSVYAFDASTGDTTSLSGDFYLQEQAVGGGVFYVYSSRSTWAKPVLSAQISFTVSDVVDDTHLTVSSTTGVVAGDVIYQTSSIFATVQTVTDGTHLVVDSTTGFTATTTYDATEAGTNFSQNGGEKNLIFCSKFGQSEAVPIENSQPVGNPNYDIIRILPLRDSTVVLKEDGLFRLSGEVFPFTVTTLDTSVILTAPESPAILNNQVYAYTNQGAVAISETGPGIVSRPIENILQQISSYLYPNFPIDTIGTNYQTDRKYILSTISQTGIYKGCTISYVYNTITETWTTYTYPVPLWDLKELIDERLYLGAASSSPDSVATYPYVFQERKSFNAQIDAADIQIPVNVVSSSGNIVELTDASKAVVGWSLAQINPGTTSVAPSVINISIITAVNVDGTHVTVADVIDWNTGASYFEQPIKIDVIYTPIHCGNPSVAGGMQNGPSCIKMFNEIQAYFQNVNFSNITFTFSSDFIVSNVPVNLELVLPTVGWGSFPWGSVPWGGGDIISQAVRTYIPLQARRAHWLNLEISLSEAMSSFTLAGFGLIYRPVSTRSK